MIRATKLLLLVVCCAVLGLILRLHIAPVAISGDHYLSQKFAEYGISYRSASLQFDGGLVIKAEKLQAEKLPDLTIPLVHIELSMSRLILGEVAPKHIQFSHIDLPNIIRTAKGFQVMGYLLPNKPAGKPFDIHSFIDEFDQRLPLFKSLKSFTLRACETTVDDQVSGEFWQVSALDFTMRRDFLMGKKLRLEARLSPRDNPTGFPVQLKLDQVPQGVRARAAVKDIRVVDFKNYLTPGVIDIAGRFSGDITTLLKRDNSWDDLDFKISSRSGHFHFKKAYSMPLSFKRFAVAGRYTSQNAGELTIDQLTLLDNNDVTYHLDGAVTKLISGRPFVNVTAAAEGATTIAEMRQYLPDLKIGNTIRWLENNIHSAKVTNLVLGFKGYPSDIPNCPTGHCGFDGSFDYQDMVMSFLSKIPAATDINGHFKMNNGEIFITAPSAFVKDHALTDASARITNLFRDDPKMLLLQGRIAGRVQSLLDILEHRLSDTPWEVKIDGDYDVAAVIDIPLGNARMANIGLDITGQGVDLVTHHFKERLEIPEAAIKLIKEPQQQQFDFIVTGDGAFKGIPLKNLRWHDDFNQPLANSQITSSGILSFERVKELGLERAGLSLSTSDIPFNINITGDNHQYHYQAAFDGRDHRVTFAPLNWRKPVGDALAVTVHGAVLTDRVSVEKIVAHGKDIDIAGQLTLDQGPVSFDFDQFKLGKSNIKLAYKEGHINVVGQVLDASFIDFTAQRGEASSGLLGDDWLTVNVDTLLLPAGVMDMVTFELRYTQGALSKLALSARLPAEKRAELSYYVDDVDLRHLDLTTDNLGYMLKSLGIFDNIHGGSAVLSLELDSNGYGRGDARMSQMNMSSMPILIQLLSLFSLQDLFNSERGVRFNKVHAPFVITPEAYTFDGVTMTGPAVSLFFDATYKRNLNQINAYGQLVPLSGLNRFIDKIPLVGDLLTGSRKGLLVANFKVDGDLTNPKITTNPLSVLTPGSLQDVWDAIISEGS